MRCLRWSGIAAMTLGMAGCAMCRIPQRGSAEQLAGEYRLVINPGQVIKGGLGEISSALESERLILYGDGTFEQECRFKNGEHFRSEKRSWRLDERNADFSLLKNCAGFLLNGNGEETGASLIVEFGKPNLILLHPDVNVYYEQVKQGPV
jgi:hypothetical protein